MADIDLRNEIKRGRKVKVVHTLEIPPQAKNQDPEIRRYVDEGKITAVPSSKFDKKDDEFDFDYRLTNVTSGKGAIRSVDLDNEIVAQMLYDTGFDRDYNVYQLEEVEVFSSF